MGGSMQFDNARPDMVRAVNQRWLLKFWTQNLAGQRVPQWQNLDVDRLLGFQESLSFLDVVRDANGGMRFLIRFHGETIRRAYASPDGRGTLHLARGIEVGHVFQLGQKYAQALNATVIDEGGKAQLMTMGCYGIGVSRIVAAAIEQRHDDAGIIWPEAMAPWRVAVCVINPKNASAAVADAAERLYQALSQRGIETVLDDRGLRPGNMFADVELIGIPHRVVVSERGLAAGTLEYRSREESESRTVSQDELFALLA